MALNRRFVIMLDQDLYLQLGDLEKHLGVGSKSGVMRLLVTNAHKQLIGHPTDYNQVVQPAGVTGKTRATPTTGRNILRLERKKPTKPPRPIISADRK